jgi:hypothetical protein
VISIAAIPLRAKTPTAKAITRGQNSAVDEISVMKNIVTDLPCLPIAIQICLLPSASDEE